MMAIIRLVVSGEDSGLINGKPKMVYIPTNPK